MDGAALVERILNSVNNRDTEALAACYATAASVHPAGWPEAVDSETWLAALGLIVQSFPDLAIRPTNVVTSDRLAIVEASLTGTNTGPFHLGDTDRMVLGTDAEQLPPTGRVMKLEGVVVFELAGGLVRSERHYWPVVDTLVQLGLVSTPVRQLTS